MFDYDENAKKAAEVLDQNDLTQSGRGAPCCSEHKIWERKG